MQAPQPERIPLTIGEIVRHSVFGEGVVQDVQGVGDDEQVTVNFSSAGLGPVHTSAVHRG